MEYTSPGRAAWWTPILMTSFYFLYVSIVEGYDPNQRPAPDLSNSFSDRTDNYYGHYEEDTSVSHEPKFLHTHTNVTVQKGKRAILPCAVKYLGTRQAAWRRTQPYENHYLTVGKMVWVQSKKYSVTHKAEGSVTHWNLEINPVEKKDEGEYQCSMTDKVKREPHSVNLRVTDPPVRLSSVHIEGNEFPSNNEKINLTCNATTGDETIPEDVDWFMDGIKIQPGSSDFRDVAITKFRKQEFPSLVSQLIINKAQKTDTGLYVCRSSDNAIAKKFVTVLISDTSNVKRRTKEKQEGGDLGDEGGSSSMRMTTSLVLVLVLVLIPLLVAPITGLIS